MIKIKQMQYEIKKIDWLTAGVFGGLLLALIGLVPMIFGLIAFAVRSLSQGFDLVLLNFLFFPIGAFIAGFILGLVFAVVYNIIAERWRGIKIDIDYNQEIKNNNQ